MKQKMHEKVQIDATTGEVYTTYPRVGKNAPGVFGRVFGWFGQVIKNHLDRTIQLRVYDDRRFNPASNPSRGR